MRRLPFGADIKGTKQVLAEQAAPTATAERQRINQLWMHQQEAGGGQDTATSAHIYQLG